MNILYLSPAKGPDYMADCLAHGLRFLYGDSFVDYPRIPYLYSDFGDTSNLYGKGFSLYATLGDDSGVDRTNIADKIYNRFYDLVIYGSIHREQKFFYAVSRLYPRNSVIFVDGEDQSHGLFALAKHGLYFKRELAAPHPGVYPIHFAIPVSKVGTLKPLLKTKVMAHSDPRDRSTYIFKTERDYYQDYAESLFAITMKKGGWDCMRHLEILANGCIPLFLDLDQCPKTTCTHLPKPELLEVLALMDKPAAYWDSNEGHAVWLSLWRRIHLKFVRYSTTNMLAQYVIETQQREMSQAA